MRRFFHRLLNLLRLRQSDHVLIGTAASLVPAGSAVRDGWRGALQDE